LEKLSVTYVEIAATPTDHARGGLSPEGALRIILDEARQSTAVAVGVIVACDVARDSPVECQRLAELCVAGGAAGFATTGRELTDDVWRFYAPTFDFLGEHRVGVQMLAGAESAGAVPVAVVRGRARRLAGAYAVTNSDVLTQDLTSSNVAVVVSGAATPATPPGWSKSLNRTLYDFQVKIAFCSLYTAFTGKTRTQQLCDIAREAGFHSTELLCILNNTFSSAFQPYRTVVKKRREFWASVHQLLAESGSTEPPYKLSYIP
jgi:hypothetical protein